MKRTRALFTAVGLLAVGVILPGGSSAYAAGPTVQGEGASFPLIELEQWRADVKNQFGIDINYKGSSSGLGRQTFLQKTVDFGVSDIPYPTGGNETPTFPFAYIPVSAGGMAFMYNLKDAAGRSIKSLKLTSSTACKIFTGQIKKWTDAEIVADNPALKTGLKTDKIKLVLRSGGAGTSYVFGDYCQKLQPAVWTRFQTEGLQFPEQQGAQWANYPGPPLGQWPVPDNGVAAGSSDQNADTVANDASGEGSICLVEAGFAKVRGFPVASVKNAAGTFIQPTDAAVTKALSYAGKDPRGTQLLTFDPPDAAAYNPSTYSYAIVTQGTGGHVSVAKGAVLAQFLNYSVTLGQTKAQSLGYAPLSQNLIDLALDLIAKIPGAPARPQFTIGTVGVSDADVLAAEQAAQAEADRAAADQVAADKASADKAAADAATAAAGQGGTGGTGGNSGSTGGGSTGSGSTGGGSTGGGATGGGDATSVENQTVGAATDGTTSAGGAPTASSGVASGAGAPAGGATVAKSSAVTSAARTNVTAASTQGSRTAGASFQEQPATRPPQKDSVLPLGWVLALGVGGYFLASRRFKGSPA
jgi:phosphate transport system substrate-binding protein